MLDSGIDRTIVFKARAVAQRPNFSSAVVSLSKAKELIADRTDLRVPLVLCRRFRVN
jgi:hypothetical protein